MHPRRLLVLGLNVIGGIAVLGSYAVGIGGHEHPGAVLWGAVPESIQPLYTLSMFTAALGYFLFGPYILWGLDPERTVVRGRLGYGVFAPLFALVLGASTLWMPLTFTYSAQPSELLWLADRLVLAVVGLGSLGLLAAVALARPVLSPRWRLLAIVGAALFTFQTGVLDATVWTSLYRG